MSRPATEPDSDDDDAVDDLPTDSESEEPLPSVAVPVKAEKSPVKKAAKKTKTTPPK